MPRDSHLLLGGLDYTKLLVYEYLSALLYKYMELNKTIATVEVPMSGSYSLYNYISNTHPLLSIII